MLLPCISKLSNFKRILWVADSILGLCITRLTNSKRHSNVSVESCLKFLTIRLFLLLVVLSTKTWVTINLRLLILINQLKSTLNYLKVITEEGLVNFTPNNTMRPLKILKKVLNTSLQKKKKEMLGFQMDLVVAIMLSKKWTRLLNSITTQ